MSNPVLVEVTRGTRVESVHRGAISVVDGDGQCVLELGDTAVPVFGRSAVKAIQALPFVESGAADAYGYGDRELSLVCASHSSEQAHIDVARSMLERAGLDEGVLECGGHWSLSVPVMREQARVYESPPPAICNNCSGKHAGFVCTAAHLGVDPAGYVKREHVIQRAVSETIHDVTGAALGEGVCGVDGCAIPTYAVPLSAMAYGFAKMATGNRLGPERARAARRLLAACMAEPFYMAGTKRFCTDYMALGGGRLFAKMGAEGVYCGAIPELGLGVALKCDDGATRGAEAMMAAVSAHLLPKGDALQPGLAAMARKTLKNRGGTEVGVMRAVLPLG